MEFLLVVAAVVAFLFIPYWTYRAGLRTGGEAVGKAMVRGGTNNLSSHRQDELAQIITQIMDEQTGQKDRHGLYLAAAYEVGSAVAHSNQLHATEVERDKKRSSFS